MRRLKLFLVYINVFLVSVVSVTTYLSAADLSESQIIELPQENVSVEFASGWYLRGGIGYNHLLKPNLKYGNNNFENVSLKPSWSVNVGAGYYFNESFRTDFTVDYSTTSKISANLDIKSNPDVLKPCPIGKTCNSIYSTDMNTWTFMANGYLDLGNFEGFTPYVGAGLGLAKVRWGKYYNFERTCENNCSGGHNYKNKVNLSSDSKLRFAWSLMAGTLIALDENWSVDIGYKFSSLNNGIIFKKGEARQVNKGASAGASMNKPLPHAISFSNLYRHELRVGFIYELW